MASKYAYVLRTCAADGTSHNRFAWPAKGNVVVSGNQRTATDYLVARGLSGVVGSVVAAGDRGTATTGDGGAIAIRHWNGNRYRMRVAEVGDGGLEPNVAYQLNEVGEFVKAEVPA